MKRLFHRQSAKVAKFHKTQMALYEATHQEKGTFLIFASCLRAFVPSCELSPLSSLGVLGLIAVGISLLADMLGYGAQPGIVGWKQVLGGVLGVDNQLKIASN